ncbi:hypothetical protein KW801_02700 [Candidatus Saccharibacteria bacterium]|nr:hypothetical protein [Candidatus Saccharibacteria bacterium]
MLKMRANKHRGKKAMEPKTEPEEQHTQVSEPGNKRYKVNLRKKQVEFSLYQAATFVFIFAVIGSFFLVRSFAASPNKKPSGSTLPPLSSTVTQNWNGNGPTNKIYTDNCFGVDSNATWQGRGTLAPGETYTFTPKYPTCGDSEVPAVSMHIDWTGVTDVRMQSQVAFIDQHSTGISSSTFRAPKIVGKTITAPILSAPNSAKQANFCEFIDGDYTADGLGISYITYSDGKSHAPPRGWTATITNTGTQAATVNFSGQETNGWIGLFYPHCNRGDSDGDHWNDALEETMLSLSGLNKVASGSDYLSSTALKDLSSTSDYITTISASPADFNADDVIDASDVAMIQQYVGKGNGIPQDEIDPNAGCSQSSTVDADTACQGVWARFDLDGDGYVAVHDVTEVQTLIGKPFPLDADYLSPWAVIEVPNTVPANYNGYIIHAFASDNDLLTHVDIYAAGKKLCSTWGTTDNFGKKGQGLFYCGGWQTPRQSGTTTLITVNAFDDAGHVYSATKTVTTQ